MTFYKDRPNEVLIAATLLPFRPILFTPEPNPGANAENNDTSLRIEDSLQQAAGSFNEDYLNIPSV
jgi:hypothetical protein